MLPAYAYISPTKIKLLNAQVQNVARVHDPVARGVLIQKITLPVQGVIMVQLKDVINTMKDNFQRTRVSEVRSEGKLGGQALVLDVEGTWRELTGVVNKLEAKHLKAVALGDLSKQIEVDAPGEILDLKNTINGMVVSSLWSYFLWTWTDCFVRLRASAAEVTEVTFIYRTLDENRPFDRVNRMSSSLTDQVRSIAVVTTAVARGDLTQEIEISVEGFVGTVNSMVAQLSAFDYEVTRVALEVGTQGILGGRARVEGVQGTWADLTRNISKMTSNLANQVVSISEMTVNSMAAQLGTLANEVTQVSLEVRREGILGGQAVLPNFQGMWKVLTDNVNLLAMNLTNQVDVRGNILELKEIRRRDGSRLGGQARATNVGGTWKGLTDNVNVMANNYILYVQLAVRDPDSTPRLGYHPVLDRLVVITSLVPICYGKLNAGL
ncbi:hypothetical protein BYT27DRAFT_7253617 [Phlegmacium glaucopus]|nr:hypothetical protein BYT27DRAFT_7253617 [Phlegmacium glaucopus]